MGIVYTCGKCGRRFQSNAICFGGTGQAYLSGNRVSCPDRNCDGMGHHEAGHYTFVDGVIAAFTAEGMTRRKVEAFRDVAERAKRQEISGQQAVVEAGSIDPVLAKVAEVAQKMGINWDRLIAIIGLLLAFYTSYSSDADVQAALKESRHQTELSQKMLSELQAQNASLHALATKSETQPQGQAKTSEAKIRRGKLKAKSLHGTTLSSPAR